MARKPRSGLDSVRDSEPVAAPDFAGADEAPDEDGRPPRLPQPCPVTPLGISGKSIVFLDRSKQLQTAPTKCDKGDMMLWFGDDWLCRHFASKWQDEKPIEWNQRRAQVAFIEDCHGLGIFSPEGRVFGRGAHRARDNAEQLVLHLGDRVMLAGPGTVDKRGKPTREPQLFPAGRVGDAYFTALARLPAPADEPATRAEGRGLLKALGRWYWTDPGVAELLMLGDIGQMFVCGALDWRTHVWLNGPTAAGKTALQKIIRAILADWCLYTEDASEAALRQVLRDDTLPVLIDEAEPHDNPERQRAIINLMKKASSGAKMYRGGADHKASEFTAQSCFLLSSVLHSPLKGEDRNRLVILDMREVPDGAEPLELELAMWRQLGRKFHRRMIEQWSRFERTLDCYKREIQRNRFTGRWADTFGTLLACADLLLFDYGPEELPMHDEEEEPDRVRKWVAKILPLMARGRVEARSDVERVQLHMLTHMLPGAHGQPPESVGMWLTRAMALKRVPGEFETIPDDWVPDEAARAKLKSYGLRVVSVVRKTGGGEGIDDALPDRWEDGYLAVAYSTNKALCEVFRGSEWADGGWVQSLGKITGPDGRIARKGFKVRFAGKPDNAVLVPLSAFQGEEGEG